MRSRHAAANSLIALRTLVSAEIHRYAERPQLPPSAQGQRGRGSGLGVRWHGPDGLLGQARASRRCVIR